VSLPIPNLDDRTFEDLVAEGLAMIPTHAPQWTNHNASDPGITLLELLAYVSESLLYRVNRVDIDSRRAFLQLLRGEPEDAYDLDDSDEVDTAIRQRVAELAVPQRAVTRADLEQLSRNAAAAHYRGDVRTFCVAGAYIEKTDRGTHVHSRAADYTVVVVPPDDPFAPQDARTLAEIRAALLPKCLLGTRLHVIDTAYVTIAARATIRTAVTRTGEEWRTLAQKQLDAYFARDPRAGADEAGWPFGRPIYTSDVMDALLRLDGVDSVDDVHFTAIWSAPRAAPTDADIVGVQVGVVSSVGESTRIGAAPELGETRLLEAGELRGIALRPYELARVVIAADGLRVIREREPV